MLSRFPTAPQILDSSETDSYSIFDHMIEIAKQGSDPGKLNSPKAIAIDSKTKEIYVIQENCANISVFSEIGNLIKIINFENINLPCGITIHEDNIYLTDFASHYIFHFKKDTTDIHLVAKHGGCGQSIGKFVRPKQLTISSNGDIFIVDSWNNRIQILDSDLHYQQPISHHCMKFPEDVKLTAEEVFVLCWGDSYIYVFSLAGERIRSLAIPIHGPFFCVDSFGNIIITNRATDRINIFTNNGTVLSTFAKPDYGVGFIQNAKGMALIDDFKLIVASSSTKSLCLFS